MFGWQQDLRYFQAKELSADELMFVIERAVKVVLLDLPQVVRDNSRLKFGVFHAGESENFNMHFRDSIREFQPVKAAVRFGLQWLWLRHHKAHAILGLYDSPFKRPVIISYDGFGEDGTFLYLYSYGLYSVKAVPSSITIYAITI